MTERKLATRIGSVVVVTPLRDSPGFVRDFAGWTGEVLGSRKPHDEFIRVKFRLHDIWGHVFVIDELERVRW